MFLHTKTFVGKLFPSRKPLCALFTPDQGRWVYEGSRSLEVKKVKTSISVSFYTTGT